MNSKLMTSLLIMCLLLINVLVSHASTGVHFRYDSASGWESIKRYGDTTVSNGILQLTGHNDKCGWVTYSTNIPLVDNATGELASFMTHFSFLINSTFTDGYGLAFFLSSNPQPISTCSSNFGLFPEADYVDNPQNQMIAVEFDTYDSDEWDPRFSHVGIDVNTIYSAAVHKYSEYDSMTNGTLAHAWVSYNAGDQTLNVSLNYHGTESPASPILSYKLNLNQLLPTAVAVGFSAANYYGEVHQIHSWEFNSSTSFKPASTSPDEAKSKPTPVLIAVLCSIGAVFLLGGVSWFLARWRISLNRNQFPRKFSHRELVLATSNFAPKNKLGEGGFGPVYKGYLRDSCDEVAVKLLKHESDRGSKEFKAEVDILSKLTHPNLVELLGWCKENNELILVYNYMPNGSLNSLLYNKHSLLLWPKRYEIVLDLADALCYLHIDNEYQKEVVHRDIKPENVLLDGELNAKLSDFGLARPVDKNLSAISTVAAGTWGYFAPESLMTEDGRIKPSTQSDIYSFGIVLLEMACGRKPYINNEDFILRYVWDHYTYSRQGLLEAADKRLSLRGDDDAKEMERVLFVGLWCAQPEASKRPAIWLARKALRLEVEDSELPVLLLPEYASTCTTTIQIQSNSIN
jgi:Legume lectin domain/Protein kinase domain